MISASSFPNRFSQAFDNLHGTLILGMLKGMLPNLIPSLKDPVSYLLNSHRSVANLLLSVALFLSVVASPVAAQSTAASWHSMLAQIDELRATGDLVQALKLAEESYRLAVQLDGPERPAAASSLYYIGTVCEDLGRFEDAEKLYTRALAIRERCYGPRHQKVAESYNNLGTLYSKQERRTEAQQALEKALAIFRAIYGSNSRDFATALNNYGVLLKRLGMLDDAERAYRTSLDIRLQILGSTHVDTAVSYNNLGSLYGQQSKFALAEEVLSMAIKIYEANKLAESADIADVWLNLAGIYDNQEAFSKSLPYYRSAMTAYSRAFRTLLHPNVATCLNNQATALYEQKDYAGAEEAYKLAIGIRLIVLGEAHSETQVTLESLRSLYAETGRSPEAAHLSNPEILSRLADEAKKTDTASTENVTRRPAQAEEGRTQVQSEPSVQKMAGERALPPAHSLARSGVWTNYQVKPGDNAAKIAKSFQMSFNELQTANPEVEWSRLKVGHKLWIWKTGP
jgi:tetratricopeptide (TPR) repeat protein